jgi:hypothetical protein
MEKLSRMNSAAASRRSGFEWLNEAARLTARAKRDSIEEADLEQALHRLQASEHHLL